MINFLTEPLTGVPHGSLVEVDIANQLKENKVKRRKPNLLQGPGHMFCSCLFMFLPKILLSCVFLHISIAFAIYVMLVSCNVNLGCCLVN